VANQFLAMGGRMTVTTRYVIEAGDLAILSNEWTYEAGGESMSAVTAEVAQRQTDGGWLYVIDNPYAGPTMGAGAPPTPAQATTGA
jgi:ketosteroid isomerase-like protein